MAAQDLVMPLMGEGVNEATVTKWLVKQGDHIEKDAPVLEVSTDKVDTEIMAPDTGYVAQILAQEGDTVEVGQILAKLTSQPGEDPGAGTSAKPSADDKPGTPATVDQPATQAAPAPSASDGGQSAMNVRSSPLVRKMAKDLNIDLNQVTGSGLHGRITKRDILAFNQQGSGATPASPAPATPVATSAPSAPAAAGPSADWSVALNTTTDGTGQEYLDGVPIQREPMSRMRQLIAKHMVESVRTSPHVTTVFEVDMHRVVTLREKHKDDFFKREGFKLTFTPFLIHAAVQAIKEHPIVNTSLDGQDVLYKKDINIGCAVALDGGLIVPVIKQAGEKNLVGIARGLQDLVNRARQKKLKPEDVQGGTFSITNPGGFGSLTSNPIINQPEVAILGIGSIVKRPVVIDDMIAIRPQMMISLTFDHRVIDGEGGARYLATLRDVLENFDEAPV
jgi:2-oxoglutarate dehydrogenase E2 component (dihydrolipoamide succinyltransferase)